MDVARAFDSATEPSTPDRAIEVLHRFEKLGRVLVGFSGGVDSALLADLAHQALGVEAVIVTAVSPSLSRDALTTARTTALSRGWRFVELPTNELERPAYVANGPDRCFHCRSELFDRLEVLRGEVGMAPVAIGTIFDDLGDHRPGLIAARERGVLMPLADAGFDKVAVRQAAADRGLDVADRPSDACLASRIPYGTPVTIGTLGQVERAEYALRKMGFRTFRVRHHGKCARIEIATEELPDLLSRRVQVSIEVKAAGYTWVSVDLDGFRSGSGNEALRPA